MKTVLSTLKIRRVSRCRVVISKLRPLDLTSMQYPFYDAWTVGTNAEAVIASFLRQVAEKEIAMSRGPCQHWTRPASNGGLGRLPWNPSRPVSDVPRPQDLPSLQIGRREPPRVASPTEDVASLAQGPAVTSLERSPARVCFRPQQQGWTMHWAHPHGGIASAAVASSRCPDRQPRPPNA
jgi:hypothetical protein